jgi:hypothetical protein
LGGEVAQPLAPPVYERPAEPIETRVVEVIRTETHGEAAEEVTAPRTQDAPERVFFHLGAGYGALGLVDLGPCQVQGLAGYVRVHVTFMGSGRVARAAVESRDAPSSDALSCIGQQLRFATVPVFEGGEVTLSKTFFVGPSGGAPPVSL